jgi:hypothetical protein
MILVESESAYTWCRERATVNVNLTGDLRSCTGLTQHDGRDLVSFAAEIEVPEPLTVTNSFSNVCIVVAVCDIFQSIITSLL